jgi:hypothetical protein
VVNGCLCVFVRVSDEDSILMIVGVDGRSSAVVSV